MVWVTNDQTIDRSESLTSFNQAIYFNKIGFNLHDTMIWEKPGASNPSINRYHQVFEYMFIFSKGIPKTFNGLKDRKNQWVKRFGKGTVRQVDGNMEHSKADKMVYNDYGLRNNVWYLKTASQENICESILHPAPFSEALASDHVLSWSNEGDLVYDPMSGSGTVPRMCVKYNRPFIASEISKLYYNDSIKKLQPLINQDISNNGSIFYI